MKGDCDSVGGVLKNRCQQEDASRDIGLACWDVKSHAVSSEKSRPLNSLPYFLYVCAGHSPPCIISYTLFHKVKKNIFINIYRLIV